MGTFIFLYPNKTSPYNLFKAFPEVAQQLPYLIKDVSHFLINLIKKKRLSFFTNTKANSASSAGNRHLLSSLLKKVTKEILNFREQDFTKKKTRNGELINSGFRELNS